MAYKKTVPAVQPTYASGAIRRGVKSRGAFAEVTADRVCALPAVADPGNGAALVDICNRRELLLPGGFDRSCTVTQTQTECLGSPVPGSTSLPRVRAAQGRAYSGRCSPGFTKFKRWSQRSPPSLEPDANRLAGVLLFQMHNHFDSLSFYAYFVQH